MFDNQSSITIKDVINESDSLVEKLNRDKEFLINNRVELILNKICDSIEENIDFRDYCDLTDDEKLYKKHYLVSVIEILLSKANECNLNLSQKDGSIYIYNNEFWEKVEEFEFKTFLGKVALKMGVYKYDVKLHSYKEELLLQFYSDASLKILKSTNQATLINLTNGTFEIGTKKYELREFNKDDFLTYQLPFNYDKNAEAPLFKRFLQQMLPEIELQHILSEYIASIFIKRNVLKIEKVLLLYGSGGNGKSVFFEIIMALLGKENVSNFSLESITKEDSKSRIGIVNKLLNYCSEITGKLESNIFKTMASGEPIEIPILYKQSIVSDNYAKLMFNCNKLPKDVENTNAFFRRFIIIPFKETIPEHKQDKELSKKIIESELSGVFNWVLDGFKRLLKNKKLTKSIIVEQEVQKFRKESDSVLMFIEENEYKNSKSGRINRTDLYAKYKSHCFDFGNRQLSASNFYKRLEQNGFTQIKSQGTRYFEIE